MDKDQGNNKSFKNHMISILSLLVLALFIMSCTMLPMCDKNGERTISGEKLSREVRRIDDDVRVSREKVEEFERIVDMDFNTVTPIEILDGISFDYQYSYVEEDGESSNIISADFVDGRKVMIVRFFKPGKIEPFYLQFQSNLYDQGYYFEDRLKYEDLCNSFAREDGGARTYLLKRENYLILLVK